MPSISYAFGLFKGEELSGVLTIGKPASHSLCIGVCGKDFSKYVYELNRLVVNEGLPENALSFFVGRSLRHLKGTDLIIVSYADEGMNHFGYIYQATNFIYTGRTAERTDKYVEGNRHSRHYDDTNSHLRKVRTPKHRYVYFINKSMEIYLRYERLPYPKGASKKYVLGTPYKHKVINRETGETWYE